MKKLTLALLPVLLFTACSVTPPAPNYPKTPSKPPVQSVPTSPVYQPPSKPQTSKPPVVTTTNQQKHYHHFDDWKTDFLNRAMAQGYDGYQLSNLLTNVSLNQRVIALDGQQAEFTKMPWEYVESAVSTQRINNGKKNYATYRSLLLQLENRYGVPASVITAIWGVESGYGQGTGNTDLVSALASLAYDGRRREFAENQLLALTKLLQQRDIYPHQLRGSWAGGMGHTQFIPTTWLAEGIDGDGDGRRNPWTIADALTSTASYLHNAGWIANVAPFYEVRLPQNFNYQAIGQTKTVNQWQNMGIQLHAHLPHSTPLELWLPAGIDGPALLLSKNFSVIRVYNNSSSYALGVSLLAKQIIGQGGLTTSWPRHEQPLSKQQVILLQTKLTQMGFDTKGTDGIIGNNTRKAFQQWQSQQGQIADGFISLRTATNLIR